MGTIHQGGKWSFFLFAIVRYVLASHQSHDGKIFPFVTLSFSRKRDWGSFKTHKLITQGLQIGFLVCILCAWWLLFAFLFSFGYCVLFSSRSFGIVP